MVKEMIILCDICKEKKANTKCFLCSKDICNDHNFGGEHSYILTNVTVYNDRVFDIKVEDTFIDCCPNCTDVLKGMMNKKRDIIENRIEEYMTEIKDWLLNEIKKEYGGNE